MSRLYDLMLLIDSSAPEDRQKAIVGEVEGLLNSGGTIAGSYDWGSRKIAFEIDHRPEAAYQLFQFEGDNALLDKLNHNLKIMDGVLRFRIVRQGPGSPPVPPSPEPIRAQRPDEPDGSRVAARAAADAPAEQDEGAAEAEAPSEPEAPPESEAPAAAAEEPETPAP
jgi:small subunit ribosomal protein S6